MNIMIDIETLSSRPDAAVTAIGACAFDATTILDEFEVLIDPMLSPGRRDDDTLDWWRSQSTDVWLRMMSGKTTPKDALLELYRFVTRQPGKLRVWANPPTFDRFVTRQPGKLRVWANPPTFDCAILRTLHEIVGVTVPWHFRDERDYRTLIALVKSRMMHAPQDVVQSQIDEVYAARTAHDALSDAICQARVVQIACRAMGVAL